MMERPLALDRETLGNDFSVSIAFIKCDPVPLIYTMLESKKGRRNCQGGWLLDEDCDVFAVASREAYEEIIPSTESWQIRTSNYLRELYESKAKNLSIKIESKLNKYGNAMKSVKSHVSMRVILPLNDPLYDDFIEKDIGCDGQNGNEKTEDLKWESLDIIQNSNGLHFSFEFKKDDINTESNEFFEPLHFIDSRVYDKFIKCSNIKCAIEFNFSALDQLTYSSKKWSDPKFCLNCRNLRREKL